MSDDKLLEQWKAAIDDERFMTLLRDVVTTREYANALADQVLLVAMHVIGQAAYERGKADGIAEGAEGAEGYAAARLAEERRQDKSRPVLRSLTAAELVCITVHPLGGPAATARNAEVAIHAEQVRLWEMAHPPDATGTPVECVQATVDLLNLVLNDHTMAVEQVRTWSIDESAQAEDWASSCHLSASDHDDVEVPMRPLFTFPPTGLWCVECGLPQYKSPGGVVCANDHGGVEGLTATDLRSHYLQGEDRRQDSDSP